MLTVKTTSGLWTPFCEQIAAFLEADRIVLPIEGKHITGYRSPDSRALWIRDHSDIVRAGRYFEADVQSSVSCFADQQNASGRIYDYVTTEPSTERENWEKWVRVPVEADVEYRFVKAAFLAWQATGDEIWIQALLPALDRALTYCMRHPWRWDTEHGLIKRAYTIDTWDFDYTAGHSPWLNFQITDDTFWGLMHGDSSGFYEAARLLSLLYQQDGQADQAAHWHQIAEKTREQANTLLFNGAFYTHFYKLTPVTIPGLDEASQLSLSNPMAINRGLATHDMAAAILRTYQQRKQTTGAFAEWFSIDPPFPDGAFGDDKLVGGAYCNGGIMPLVGGELAHAAFSHGFETYGVDILQTYRCMIADTGETYLWYFPDGTPSSVDTSTSPEAMPTDGWGSSAMLYAFIGGLCGIEDRLHSFKQVRCSPRWLAANEDEAHVSLSYAASGASFGYRYTHDAAQQTIHLSLEAEDTQAEVRVLLPGGTQPTQVLWDEQPIPFSCDQIEASLYVVVTKTIIGHASVQVTYANA